MSILRPAGTSRPADLTARSRLRVGRRVALLILVTLLATALYSAASASSSSRTRARAGRPEATAPARAASTKTAPAPARPASYAPALLRQFAADTPLPPVEKIQIRSADCSVLKDSFLLGETVCVKVFDGPSRAILNRLTLTGPAGNYRNPANTDAGATDPTTGAVSTFGVTTDPQTFTIQLPTTATSMIDGVAVENRGEWQVNSLLASRFLIRNTASFSVSETNHPSSDLAVYNNLGSDPGNVGAGASVDYVLLVANNGPDAAQNVTVSDSVLANATLVSATQTSGTPFTCPNADMAGNCTDGTWKIASLPRKSAATFKLTYQISGGATAGSVITNTAVVNSDTDDPAAANNTSVADITLASGAAEGACVLSCPGNITRTADTTDENDQPGAIVIFGGAETQGSCGTLTASKPSGSFFPAGTTTVTISSSSGASCSFVVTVVNTPPPTISCPAPVTKQAADGDCNATLTAAELGTPDATGTDVAVTSARSDGLDLDAPFPAGATTITYTATDSIGRTASCTQTVTVNVNDAINPTITAPPDVSFTTGSGGVVACGRIVSEAELGTADADDNCSVTVTRAGIPAGNFFPVGVTTITYTAKDGAGNTATATQKVTVTETTPPIIFAPPDANYTCLSEVPEASPSQAGGPVLDGSGSPVIDGNGDLVPGGQPYDNCGVPVVTVTETSSGAGNLASPRVILRTFKATDASGNFATATQTIKVIDNTPPTINAPADVTLGTGPGAVSCSAVVGNAQLGTATAGDNCAGVTVTRTGVPAGNVFPKGTTTVTYTATDAAGNTATATQQVTVNDTTPPVLTVNGADPLTVECHTSFTDPGATAADACDGSVAVGSSNNVNVNVPGTYSVNYTATDAAGNTATGTRTVNVVDTTPPVITLNGQMPSMWPANHKYRTFLVTDFVTGATDSCNTALGLSSVVIEKVTSDEVENGNGDGNTMNDIVLAANCKSVQLRAEREGNGNGRVYTITFKVTDASGNTGRATAKVVVPHNPGETPTDSGVHYTVNGSCP